MSNQDDPKRGSGQPLKLPSSGAPRRDKQSRPTPPPSRNPPPGEHRRRPLLPKFGGQPQFRSLPGQSIAPSDSQGDRTERDDGAPREERDRFEARHAPPDREDEWARGYGDESRQLGVAPRWDQSEWEDGASREMSAARPARDPWDRDWQDWSALEDDDDDADAWQSRSRAAWGGWPADGTMASVAMVVAPHMPVKSQTAGKETAAVRQVTRWARAGFARGATPSRRVMRMILLVSILGTILLTSLGVGGVAYSDYSSIKGLADSGLSALEHVGTDLGFSGHPLKGGTVDKAHVAMAEGDINLAISDFQQIQNRLENPDFILSMADRVGKIHTMLQSGLILSTVAIEAANVMKTFLPALIGVANIVSTSPLSTSASIDDQPLLTTDNLYAIEQVLPLAMPTINEIINQVESTPSSVLLAAVPGSKQKSVAKYLDLVPQIKPALQFLISFLPIAKSVLNIQDPGQSQPVAYLLMTLDNAELRPVGGFQGQYAIFSVNGAHIGHISLQDVYHVLEPIIPPGVQNNYRVEPGLAPVADSWINNTGLNFALRNSGVSGDFPTSARDALIALKGDNFCYPVGSTTCYPTGDRLPIVNSNGDITGYQNTEARMAGVIMFQPRLIQQIIGLTGPLHIACPYNVTVTSSNLETLIHQYQETTTGRHQGAKGCNSQISDSTKRFTALLGQALQQQVKAMPKDKLLSFAAMALGDLKTKDLQIYFTNPSDPNFGPNATAEQYLTQYQATGALYSGPQDSLAISQANYIGDKMNRFLTINEVDQVTLDNSGGATHQLLIDYNWNIPAITVPYAPAVAPQGSAQYTADMQAIYNVIFNAQFNQFYREYRRIYVNPNAVLITYDPATGQQAYSGFPDPNAGVGSPLDAVVTPSLLPSVAFPFQESNGTSDVPGRAAIAGDYVYEWQVNSDQTVSWSAPDGVQNPAVSWYVPGVARQGEYVLHLQPQSGMPTTADITITPPPCATNQAPLTFNHPLTSDTTITLTFAGCKF